MILSRLFAALAVAALIACAFLWMGRTAADARADAAEQRAQALQGELSAARAAHARDIAADQATTVARKAAQARIPDQEARRQRVEAIAHESRPAVPAVCPEPDARVLRESADATARIRAAEGRLRGY